MVAITALALPALARAQPRGEARPEPSRKITIEGVVERTGARWVGGSPTSSNGAAPGAIIVTRAEIRDTAGTVHTVWQLGGTVDGIGMVVLHTPMLLRAGDRVTLQASAGRTTRGQQRWVVDSWAHAGKSTRHEFVHTTTKNGTQLRWANTSCAVINYAAEGTAQIPGDEERAIMDAVLATWADAVSDCSHFRVASGPPLSHGVGYDFINMVVFRDDEWCRPAIGDMPEQCYNPLIAGLTTLTFVNDPDSPRDGEILDADIELNGVNFAIAAEGGDDGSPPCESVLANTFTHEIGHLIGLDHTCWDKSGQRPVDNNGDEVPSCDEPLTPAITEATMFTFQSCGETKKASLEADDIAGVCAAYPQTANRPVCQTVRADVVSGCPGASVAQKPGPARHTWLVMAALAVAVFAFRRSRAGRR